MKTRKSVLMLAMVAGMVIIAALLLGIRPTPAVAQSAAFDEYGQRKEDVAVVRSDLQGLVLEVVVPDLAVTEQALEGGVCQSIAIPGWSHTAEQGAPQLPVYRAMLGVPPNASVRVQVVYTDGVWQAEDYNVCPVPTTMTDWGGVGFLGETRPHPQVVGQTLIRDPVLYSTDEFYPAGIADLVDDGFIRQQRYVGLEIRPVQYNPVAGQLVAFRRVRVELSFGYSEQGPGGLSSAPEPEQFERFLQQALLNYETAMNWRAPRARGQQLEQRGGMPASQGDWFKVSVEQDGIYVMTYSDLANAGLPVDSLDPRTFQLFNMGQEAAIYVEGEDDGDFEPGEYILFYGTAINDSKYTDTNVYWLTYDQAPGLRMAERDGSLSGSTTVPAAFKDYSRIEQNLYYVSVFEGDDELDRWIWDWIYAASSTSKNYSILLTNVSSGVYTATLQAPIYGYVDNAINPDHHTRIYVNGNLVEDAWWDGIGWRETLVEFPSSYLLNGQNTITVQCPNDTGVGYDLVYLDWFKIGYPRTYAAVNDLLAFSGDEPGTWEYQIDGFSTADIKTFDVTDPWAVARVLTTTVEPVGAQYRLRFEDDITGQTRYVALTDPQFLAPLSIVMDLPSTLSNPGNGADYIIVTHRDFYADVLPLATYRQSLGYRVQVVDVQDVYDEFNYGIFSPHAIHSFLEYAYSNWAPPAPTYVLLVGDGTADYKDYRNTGRKNYIPPMLARVDPWVGEVAVDNRYVCVSGSDIFPDMSLGRLPAVSVAEVQGMVSKTLNYEQNVPPGDWREQITFAADNVPDTAGDFVAYSNDLITNYLPGEYTADPVFINAYCGPPTSPPTDCPAARQALVNSINAGRLLVNYIGHGMVNKWAAESLWTLSALSSLTNATKFPIMLAITCDEGAFQNPYSGLQSIGANAVRIAGKGAAASWSPTGQSTVAQKHFLDQGFFEALFSQGVRELGTATLLGKLKLYQQGSEMHLLDIFVLFGDPALHINALDTDLRVEKTVEPTGVLAPGDVLTYTLTFTNVGPAGAYGVVLTDFIPAPLINPTVVFSTPAGITPHPGTSFVWDIPDLPPHSGGEIQVRATVDPHAYSQMFSNRADTTSRTPDTDASNNRALLSSQVAGPTYVPNADVRLSKTVEPTGRVHPGDVLTYTLSFVNEGPDTAEHGLLTDFVPSSLLDPHVVYSSPVVISQTAVSQPEGTTFRWGIADLPPYVGGEVQMRAVAGTPVGLGFIVNEAEISSNTPDINPSNNVVSVTSDVLLPNLFVSKSGPAGVSVGQTITYTIAWGNQGGFAAPGVRITDTLPAWVTYVSDSSGFSLTQPSPGLLVWQVAPDPVPADTSATFVLTGWVQIDPAMVGPLTNAVQIAGLWADDDPSDNQGQCVTDLLLPDVQLAKSVDPTGQVDPGALLTYTLTFTNNGPGMAYGVVVTDLLPATLVSPTVLFSSPAVISQQVGVTFAWTISPLAPGAGGSIQLRAQVSPTLPLGSVVVNEAEIAVGTLDVNPSNNIISVTTGIRAPDLFVHKTGPLEVSFGQALTYTISWGNEGEMTATGVRLTDTLPIGVDYVADNSGIMPTWDPGTHRLVWQVPDDVPTGTQVTFVLTGWVALDPGLVSPLENRVRIKSEQFDADPSDDMATWSTDLLWPDLGLAKTGPSTAIVLTEITYTLSYSNASEGLALSTVLTDLLPAGVTYVSDNSGLPHNEPVSGTHVWEIGDLAAGAGGSFVVTVAVGDYAEVGDELVNTALIGSPSPDSNPANHTADWTTALLLPDLGLAKTGPATAVVLSEITYTLAYSNAGEGLALGTVLTDLLPAGVTYVSDDSGLLHSEPVSGTHVWEIGDLAAGAGGSFVVTVAVGDYAEVGDDLVNTARIGSPAPDSNPANHTADWTTALLLPDLVVTKTGPAQAGANWTLTYTLVYSNVGAGPALGVVLTDVLPAGLTYLSDDSGFTPGQPSPGVYVWEIGDLAAGAGGAFHILAQVDPTVQPGDVLTNAVQIGADSPDVGPGNDLAQWAVSVIQTHSYIYLPLAVKAAP